MQRLADLSFSPSSALIRGRRFTAYAGECALCGDRLVNELFTVVVAGSEISVFVCATHPDMDVVDEIVWTLAQHLRKLSR